MVDMISRYAESSISLSASSEAAASVTRVRIDGDSKQLVKARKHSRHAVPTSSKSSATAPVLVIWTRGVASVCERERAKPHLPQGIHYLATALLPALPPTVPVTLPSSQPLALPHQHLLTGHAVLQLTQTGGCYAATAHALGTYSCQCQSVPSLTTLPGCQLALPQRRAVPSLAPAKAVNTHPNTYYKLPQPEYPGAASLTWSKINVSRSSGTALGMTTTKPRSTCTINCVSHKACWCHILQRCRRLAKLWRTLQPPTHLSRSTIKQLSRRFVYSSHNSSVAHTRVQRHQASRRSMAHAPLLVIHQC